MINVFLNVWLQDDLLVDNILDMVQYCWVLIIVILLTSDSCDMWPSYPGSAETITVSGQLCSTAVTTNTCSCSGLDTADAAVTNQHQHAAATAQPLTETKYFFQIYSTTSILFFILIIRLDLKFLFLQQKGAQKI